MKSKIYNPKESHLKNEDNKSQIYLQLNNPFFLTSSLYGTK